MTLPPAGFHLAEKEIVACNGSSFIPEYLGLDV